MIQLPQGRIVFLDMQRTKLISTTDRCGASRTFQGNMVGDLGMHGN